MHVALSDKTYALLGEAGVPSLEKPAHNAELKLKDHAKAVYAAKIDAAWQAEKLKEETDHDETSTPIKSAWEVYKEKYAEPGE
jgi:cation transport regulator ChaB